MKKKRILSWALAGALVVVAAPAQVLVVNSDRDNTLYEDQDGTTSNGQGMHFFAGLTISGAVRRGLVHFDVSTIPPGSTIDSVVLTLNMSRTIGGPAAVSLHRAEADWGEAGSDAPGEEGAGAPAENGDATWLHTFFATDFWASPGGDFAPAASSTTTVGAEGVYTWGTSAGMEADVSAWVDDPDQNFGWVVVGEEAPLDGKEESTAKRFDSREVGTEGTLMPELVVNFTAPVPVELQSFAVDSP